LTAVKKAINRVRFGGEDAEQFIVRPQRAPRRALFDARKLFWVTPFP
jgi:hypothetical protein